MSNLHESLNRHGSGCANSTCWCVREIDAYVASAVKAAVEAETDRCAEIASHGRNFDGDVIAARIRQGVPR